jgi:hypothetical protein
LCSKTIISKIGVIFTFSFLGEGKDPSRETVINENE